MHPNHPWNVWSTIVRWKKVLIGLSFFSALIALIFSLPWMITPKYKSVVIMFPVSTSSLASSMLSELAWSDEDLLEFGEKEQADNLIQVLESDHIRQQIVQRFHLMEHYRIDPGDPYPMTELKRAYKRNISARRTEFNAVRLTVLDTDPALAMEIANKITGLLDSTIHRMQRQRAERAVEIALDAYQGQMAYIRQLEDSLSRVMRHGVHDYESQAQVLYEELAVQLAHQNRSGIRSIEDKLSRLARYGGAYISLRDELELEKERLSILKVKFEKARMDARQDLPQKFIVDEAFKAEKKAYPMIWAIVAGTALSTFLLVLLVILAYERLRLISGALASGSGHVAPAPQGQ